MESWKYKVIFSNRRSLSIVLHPVKGITVRAPYRTSLKTIEKFVLQKTGWIQKTLDKYKSARSLNETTRLSNGEKIMFMGKEYEVKTTHSENGYFSLHNNILEIGLGSINDPVMIRAKLNRWYMNKAREIIPLRITEKIKKYHEYAFIPTGIRIRKMKSRWGSCNLKGRITINSELIKVNVALIDYVIIHELCHLKYHNHSTEFYLLLQSLVPGYKALRKELRAYHLE
jgi:predicted metal-dependent hydrolase